MAETEASGFASDQARVVALEVEMGHVATKADIEKVRTEIQSLKVWMLGVILTAVVFNAGLTVGLLKVIGP